MGEKSGNAKREGDRWERALPLILGAWHDTPALLKMLRLKEHIDWAEQHDVLDEVGKFLRVSWHSFRHTHATLLHANGASLKTAQDLLGHEDPETTLKVYTHSVPDSQRQAVERVAGVLFSDVLNSEAEAIPRGRYN